MYEKTLGLSGLRVSAVGLGCMGMSHAYGAPADELEMTELLADTVEMGYTLFDTAEVYCTPDSLYHNEELLGKALRPLPQRKRLTCRPPCGQQSAPVDKYHYGSFLAGKPLP